MHFESGTHVKKLPKSRGDEIDDGALYDVLLEEINKTAEICDYEVLIYSIRTSKLANLTRLPYRFKLCFQNRAYYLLFS